MDEERSRRSLRARRRENTSALYIFLDRPGHNSGDESVLLGPHRTHTLADRFPTYVPRTVEGVAGPFARLRAPLGAIRVEARRVTL